MDPRVDIGHVHLKVADIDRALGFYRDVLGFDVTQRFGDSAAFVSAGGYHHHIGLNTWESRGGPPPPPGTTGLYHVAIRFPDRKTLAQALRRVLEARIPLEGASDHGVSEAIYLRDPDGNGIELYRDRPREDWPRDGDGVAMVTALLELLVELFLERPEARSLGERLVQVGLRPSGPPLGEREVGLRFPRQLVVLEERRHELERDLLDRDADADVERRHLGDLDSGVA